MSNASPFPNSTEDRLIALLDRNLPAGWREMEMQTILQQMRTREKRRLVELRALAKAAGIKKRQMDELLTLAKAAEVDK